MPHHQKRLRSKLIHDEKPIGIQLQNTTLPLRELPQARPLDFILLDDTILIFEPAMQQASKTQLEEQHLPLLIELQDNTIPHVLQACGLFADGILIPDIHTEAEAKEMIDQVLFPPTGKRRQSYIEQRLREGSRTMRLLLRVLIDHQPMLIPICDNQDLLQHMDGILSPDGIDGIFLDPVRLAAALDLPLWHDEMLSAMESVKAACHRAQKPCILLEAEGMEPFLAEPYDAFISLQNSNYTKSSCRAVFLNARKAEDSEERYD